LHFFLEISKLFQKIIPFFEKVFQKTRFFEKMLLEILRFLFFLSEVDVESCFTLRKTIFKREPLQFHLPNDAKKHEVIKYISNSFSKKIMHFEKYTVFQEEFREVFRILEMCILSLSMLSKYAVS
jgi:hypothetical protein